MHFKRGNQGCGRVGLKNGREGGREEGKRGRGEGRAVVR